MSGGFIRYLEDSGYELVADGPGKWLILACHGHRFVHAPVLVLPAGLFDEYVAEVERESGGGGMPSGGRMYRHLEGGWRRPAAPG